jgi:hypothetical protein
MKLLLPLPFLLLAACTAPGHTDNEAHDTADAVRAEPDPQHPALRKQAVDTLLAHGRGHVSHYGRLADGDAVVPLGSDDLPVGMTTTYQVLRDGADHVVLVIESPVSESGDWSIAVAHYFDAQGRTYAFERRAAFFNSLCTDGLAHERSTRYYDHDGRELGSRHDLHDAAGHPLKREDCEFPYDFPYTMYPSLAELAATTGLPIP